MKHTLTEILSTLTASLPAGRTLPRSQRLPLVLAMLVTSALGGANAQTASVLHVFDTEDACDTQVFVDAGTPVYSGILAQGLDGSIYSSTSAGGACGYGYGAAYQITVSGNLTPLHSFGFVGNEGVQADGGLNLATDGNFYGTTKAGGTHSLGTIFMITPGGALTYLHQFNGTDGAYPTAPPIQGLDGYFYGTTSQGGTGTPGVVYKMQPKFPWTLTSYSLTNFGYPAAPLVQATDGYFYGTAVSGGTHGYGVVFRITSSGNVTVVFNFDNTNGSQPIPHSFKVAMETSTVQPQLEVTRAVMVSCLS